jgi:enoyl-CoA hydratase/carnithine racemase
MRIVWRNNSGLEHAKGQKEQMTRFREREEALVKYKTLLLDEMDGIIVIRLNRPEKLNAINGKMRDEFSHVLGRVEADKEVRVLIVTGSGRGFCAGADIDELSSMSFSDNGDETKKSINLVKQIYEFEKPIIGAINGIAVGDGAQWALAFDLNLASENATFAWPATRLGLL